MHNRCINYGTKMRLHKVRIRPVVMYAAETKWLLRKDEEKHMLFERKIIANICTNKIKQRKTLNVKNY